MRSLQPIPANNLHNFNDSSAEAKATADWNQRGAGGRDRTHKTSDPLRSEGPHRTNSWQRRHVSRCNIKNFCQDVAIARRLFFFVVVRVVVRDRCNSHPTGNRQSDLKSLKVWQRVWTRVTACVRLRGVFLNARH